jgi:hypothetical protein
MLISTSDKLIEPVKERFVFVVYRLLGREKLFYYSL